MTYAQSVCGKLGHDKEAKEFRNLMMEKLMNF